ncbi:MAG: tetratricopeptide repeat protein [Archangium sp.]|nr:tetratricopeptide repeat protein [Archangium sp.]
MMLALVVAVTVCAGPSGEQRDAVEKSEAFRQQMSEAIQRHDSGDYAGAIAIYKSMLKQWPHHPGVVYELSFSMNSSGAPPKEVIAMIEGELKSMKNPKAQIYSTLGTAYDTLGQLPKGEANFRKGLKLDPKNADLVFNLGINLAMQKKESEAEPQFARAAELAPNWPSVWRAAAITLETNGKAIDSVLARLNFVVLEPDSERGTTAAKAIDEALDKLVTRKGNNINVNMGGNSEDLGMQLMLAAAVAEDEKKSASEQKVSAVKKMIDFGIEDEATKGFRTTALTRLAEAKEAGCLEALLWEWRRSAKDPAALKWFAAHRDQEEKFATFISSQRRR